MSIKFYIKKIVAFIVLTIIIEVFVFYFSKLPRLAHYINSCNFFKTNIGSSILWGYLQIVPLIIPVIISLLFIGVYLKNDCITYLKMYNKQWIKAIIIGVSHASIVMIIAFAFEIIGSFYTIQKNDNCNFMLLVIFFLGYIMQALKEEILYRGILFQSLSEKNSNIAVIISAIMFSLSHWENRGFSLLPGISLFLFGIITCLLYRKTESIWSVVSFHCLWNYLQGYIGGIEISGIEPETSIFSITYLSNNVFFTGGLFGIEGSIFCTGCLLITMVLLLWDERRTNCYEK